MTLGAVIMLGGGAQSTAEALLLSAQRAATLDLVNLIQAHLSARLIISAPEFSWWPRDVEAALEADPNDQPFHFGARLADLIAAHDLSHVLYFGGGSAPLLDGQIMQMLADLLGGAGRRGSPIPSHIALANNRHSSDWVAISHVGDALDLIRQTHRDNSLAWMLQESGLYELRIPAGFRPATSMDIDTPADLAILRLHPDCPPHLKAVLTDPLLDAIPAPQLLKAFKTDGTHIALIGRVAPLAWQAVSKTARCWIRVFSEERGMIASGRADEGRARSLLGALLRAKGMAGFFEALADTAEAAIIDSRVLMADHRAEQPSRADRFASDLYQVADIQDPWLRDFTQAALEAPLPILLGGHSVVAGGLYALAELIER